MIKTFLTTLLLFISSAHANLYAVNCAGTTPSGYTYVFDFSYSLSSDGKARVLSLIADKSDLMLKDGRDQSGEGVKHVDMGDVISVRLQLDLYPQYAPYEDKFLDIKLQKNMTGSGIFSQKLYGNGGPNIIPVQCTYQVK